VDEIMNNITISKAVSKTADAIIIAIMIIAVILTVYPFYYAVINSLNEGNDLLKGYVLLWPRKFTWDSWKAALSDSAILNALAVTASRTVIVTVFQLFITSMFAYAFSRPYLKHKKFYAALGFCSMYISGGIIPFFLLISALGLYDTYWVYIIPSLFGGFYNVIIFTSNYKAIPASLFESAKLDGAGEFRIFLSIVTPLTKPVLAALGVFSVVGLWNDYSTSLYYTQKPALQTLQYYILKLVKSRGALEQLQSSVAGNPEIAQLFSSIDGSGTVTAKSLELAAMVLATIPMVIMYPFAQKFFAQGMLVGSVKG